MRFPLLDITYTAFLVLVSLRSLSGSCLVKHVMMPIPASEYTYVCRTSTVRFSWSKHWAAPCSQVSMLLKRCCFPCRCRSLSRSRSLTWTGAGAALSTFVLVHFPRAFSLHTLPHSASCCRQAACPLQAPMLPTLAVLKGVAHAGFFYTLDLIFNFHVGFIGKFNTQKTLVMDGRAIARFYVTKGTFAVDCITACCWTAQVGSACSRLP